MKNNKIFNRTFKVSLVAAALGLVNSALAANVACNSGGVTITGQSGTVLNQCSINPTSLTNDPEWGSLSAVTMTNSSGQLNNVNASLEIPANRRNSFEVVNITNSSVNIDGGNYSITNPHNASPAGYLFDINNSTTNISNAKLSIGASSNGLFDIFHIDNNSTLTINNSEITINDDSSILSYEASNENQNSKVVINNSSLSAPNGGIIGVISGLNGETHGNFSITFNNSTVQGLGLTSAEDVNGQADSLSENLTIISNDSKLSGIAYVDGSNSKINLALNNSSWNISTYFNEEENKTVQNSLTNLSLNNGTVYFDRFGTNYQTLTIKGDLTGNGTFYLNTLIPGFQSDKIVVLGKAEGNHKLNINEQGTVAVANSRVTLVETHGGDATFSLTNPNNRVDLGAYQYFLTKEGNNWVLANSKNVVTPSNPVVTPSNPVVTPSNPVVTPSNPAVTPSNPAVTPSNPVVTPSKPVVTPSNPVVTPSNPVVTSNNPVVTPSNPVVPSAAPVLPSTPLLSDLANAQVSLRQTQLLLVEDDLSGIHQRLGEVENGEKDNVWVRNVNSRQKLAALSTGESETSGFKQNVHRVQVGADAAVTDNLRVGGFVGRSQANVDFNGHYGDGKVRSNSVGLYAAYLADNGIYVDNIVKYSRLRANSDHTEKRHYNAYTISSELGKRFSLVNDWTITPQAQLAWTRISSQENEDSLSSVYSRIGLRVAKGFALSNGWNLQPYAEVNAITSKNRSSKIHYTNSALDVASSRGRFKSAVGLNAGFANHRFGLEVSRADGKNFDKPYAIQANYHYSW
ncbi:autotransporter outer membrane beta-barrel domain-containing protein [Haemophilus haemolyticus]|uniref:autotransporter outer membrane beta-barrel domain-containing protein n=1 Tax=Haemophilus haemolyticus TaxID=726 RepID=UPI0021590324|nr:autotransporter outer membrane beta-barrel domain-containing protein [Haemophilus haemolyticus]